MNIDIILLIIIIFLFILFFNNNKIKIIENFTLSDDNKNNINNLINTLYDIKRKNFDKFIKIMDTLMNLDGENQFYDIYRLSDVTDENWFHTLNVYGTLKVTQAKAYNGIVKIK
jgi:hypothetical protein